MQDLRKILEKRTKDALKAFDRDWDRALEKNWANRKFIGVPKWLADKTNSYGREQEASWVWTSPNYDTCTGNGISKEWLK